MIEQQDKNELLQISDVLAYKLFINKMFDEALIQAELTLRLDPLNPKLHFNAARCAYYCNKYEKAIEHMNIALLFEESEDYKRELALYLPWIGKEKEAIEILNKLPKDPRTKFNLGWYEMKKGNYFEAFKLIENGRMLNCWGSNIQLPIPRWDGSDIRGKKLLVVSEGGVGDEIIFARFVIDLVGEGVDVSVATNETSKCIYDNMNLKTVNIDDFQDFEYWIPSMSLPYIMKKNDVGHKPYLKANEKYVEKWKEKISINEFNIGIRWQGGKLYEHDQRRTIPSRLLAESLDGLGNLYSLQKDSDESCPRNVIDLEDELESWNDTIAVISLMDVVITSCTSIAHIAGALGKRTIVLVPILSYFTWAKEGKKSDWYDSVEICRQNDPNSWVEPVKEALNLL